MLSLYSLGSDPTYVSGEVWRRIKDMEVIPKTKIFGAAILFGVNIIIFFVAVWKGYVAFDTVPYYAKKAEELRIERAEYRKKIEKAKKGLELNLSIPSQEEISNNLEQYVKYIAPLQTVANEEIARIYNSCKRQLQAYRTANKEAREAHIESEHWSVPEYFEDFPVFGPIQELGPQISNVNDIKPDVVRDALAAHHNAALKTLESISNGIQNNRIDKHKHEANVYEWEINAKDREEV